MPSIHFVPLSMSLNPSAQQDLSLLAKLALFCLCKRLLKKDTGRVWVVAIIAANSLVMSRCVFSFSLLGNGMMVSNSILLLTLSMYNTATRVLKILWGGVGGGLNKHVHRPTRGTGWGKDISEQVSQPMNMNSCVLA